MKKREIHRLKWSFFFYFICTVIVVAGPAIIYKIRVFSQKETLKWFSPLVVFRKIEVTSFSSITNSILEAIKGGQFRFFTFFKKLLNKIKKPKNRKTISCGLQVQTRSWPPLMPFAYVLAIFLYDSYSFPPSLDGGKIDLKFFPFFTNFHFPAVDISKTNLSAWPLNIFHQSSWYDVLA